MPHKIFQVRTGFIQKYFLAKRSFLGDSKRYHIDYFFIGKSFPGLRVKCISKHPTEIRTSNFSGVTAKICELVSNRWIIFKRGFVKADIYDLQPRLVCCEILLMILVSRIYPKSQSD